MGPLIGFMPPVWETWTYLTGPKSHLQSHLDNETVHRRCCSLSLSVSDAVCVCVCLRKIRTKQWKHSWKSWSMFSFVQISMNSICSLNAAIVDNVNYIGNNHSVSAGIAVKTASWGLFVVVVAVILYFIYLFFALKTDLSLPLMRNNITLTIIKSTVTFI